MKGRVRLKDVAARAGVAINTASTILNRRPNSWASQETTERVFQAAKELGYRPSKTARALRSGRYETIGLLIQDLTNPFFSTLAEELEVNAEEIGLNLVVENCRSSLIREKKLIAELDELEIDGSVLWLSDNEVFRQELQERYDSLRPTVILGNGIPEHPFPVDAVLSDFTQGLRDAVDALFQMGHRRFAFLSALAEGQADGKRPRLFQEMLTARGVSACDVHILRTGHTMESACETLCTFLKKPRERRPTALFAMNDVAAIGAMRAAIECGLRVPQDISIVGVDDIPICSYLPISLTTIRQRYRAITSSAMELLNSRIEAEENLPPRQIIHPTVFVRRESVATISK